MHGQCTEGELIENSMKDTSISRPIDVKKFRKLETVLVTSVGSNAGFESVIQAIKCSHQEIDVLHLIENAQIRTRKNDSGVVYLGHKSAEMLKVCLYFHFLILRNILIAFLQSCAQIIRFE